MSGILIRALTLPDVPSIVEIHAGTAAPGQSLKRAPSSSTTDCTVPSIAT